MNVESVFIDIDGTLMDSHGKITDTSVRLIKELMQSNVKIVINSGRIFPEIKAVLKKAGLVLPVIGCNGGFITDDKCEKFKVLNLMPKDSLTECIEICRNQNAIKCCSTPNHFYADEALKPFMERTKKTHAELAAENLMDEPVYVKDSDWPELVAQKKYVKFNAYAGTRRLQSQLEKKLSNVPGVFLALRGRHFLEYSASGINKGTSMITYLHMHGLHRENAAAIGDDVNDIQMVQTAGIGVAMGNADEALKKQADVITGAIDKNGLSQALSMLM
ncbi:MAG TPA: hypothetical protein DIV41_05680 [Ruminococcaceae bacterium]|jgi:hypothetical protein|nr:hypothetical protein [Oscillospiraceae bacterium]